MAMIIWEVCFVLILYPSLPPSLPPFLDWCGTLFVSLALVGVFVEGAEGGRDGGKML